MESYEEVLPKHGVLHPAVGESLVPIDLATELEKLQLIVPKHPRFPEALLHTPSPCATSARHTPGVAYCADYGAMDALAITARLDSSFAQAAEPSIMPPRRRTPKDTPPSSPNA